MNQPIEREPAVAGAFYPESAKDLRAAVKAFLSLGEKRAAVPRGEIRALIVPHAGYVYSGSVAGTAYAALKSDWQRIKRVVLLGPAHRVPFRGLALSHAAFFVTPLGKVRIDTSVREKLKSLSFVSMLEEAHVEEHSLEVQLPFLQEMLGDFELIPLVVGHATGEQVYTVLEALKLGNDTLVVISSDLSHYLSDAEARKLDAQTSRAIEQLIPDAIPEDGACGLIPVQGLLSYAREHKLRATTMYLANSSDAGGSHERVVGYGAYAFTEE